jgi:hypothetical protein
MTDSVTCLVILDITLQLTGIFSTALKTSPLPSTLQKCTATPAPLPTLCCAGRGVLARRGWSQNASYCRISASRRRCRLGGGEAGHCLAIVLIENAHPSELAGAFLGLTRGYDVPVGTVVVLSCLSHLGRVGTAAYAANIVKAFGRIHGAFGKGVRTVHGFPLLRGGGCRTKARFGGSGRLRHGCLKSTSAVSPPSLCPRTTS